jgi:glycosyltransferase involved in cell wall biosynthesis
MKRLIIYALGLSPPGTMGGNSKIALETARCLSDSVEVHFVVPEEKLKTLNDSIGRPQKLIIHTLPAFNKDDIRHPIAAVRHNFAPTRELFRQLAIGEDDIVFTISDFHIDVIPIYHLQRKFKFKWLPSVFLFVPFLVENLSKGYRFPPVKYLVYWFYQRALFSLMKRRATGFVVTNESDYHHFPKRFSGKLFAYYGGVNVDQIPSEPRAKKYDVVFCSRLHPQKGIDAFLEVWKQVQAERSESTIAIIGNGSKQYEAYLKKKAKTLGISNSVEWLGYVNNEAKFNIYTASRVFVHPTVFDNNGMVAAEALHRPPRSDAGSSIVEGCLHNRLHKGAVRQQKRLCQGHSGFAWQS